MARFPVLRLVWMLVVLLQFFMSVCAKDGFTITQVVNPRSDEVTGVAVLNGALTDPGQGNVNETPYKDGYALNATLWPGDNPQFQADMTALGKNPNAKKPPFAVERSTSISRRDAAPLLKKISALPPFSSVMDLLDRSKRKSIAFDQIADIVENVKWFVFGWNTYYGIFQIDEKPVVVTMTYSGSGEDISYIVMVWWGDELRARIPLKKQGDGSYRGHAEFSLPERLPFYRDFLVSLFGDSNASSSGNTSPPSTSSIGPPNAHATQYVGISGTDVYSSRIGATKYATAPSSYPTANPTGAASNGTDGESAAAASGLGGSCFGGMIAVVVAVIALTL